MNNRKHQELLDFREYEHGFDNEDGSVSIDEDITFECLQQKLQIELEHINETELEQEFHPIKDDDIQPKDEHPGRTLSKRDIRAIALKRMEDAARSVSDFEEVIKQWDHLDDNRERKERYHKIGRENTDSRKDVAPLSIVSSFLYYQDYDRLNENERNLYRQGMAAFGGVAPTYHTELRERPALVWDFNSLLLCVQMMFSFMLTDDNSSLKVCKHCGKAFVATRPNMEFDTPQCKNQYNVYKSRARKNDTPK